MLSLKRNALFQLTVKKFSKTSKSLSVSLVVSMVKIKGPSILKHPQTKS